MIAFSFKANAVPIDDDDDHNVYDGNFIMKTTCWIWVMKMMILMTFSFKSDGEVLMIQLMTMMMMILMTFSLAE